MKQCDADQVDEELGKGLRAGAQKAVLPLLKSAAVLTEQIREYDQQIEEIAQKYPVDLLKQV